MHVVWICLRTHQNDGLALFFHHPLGGICVEVNLSDGCAGRGIQALSQQASLLLGVIVKARVQKLLDLCSFDA
jgi:hypothetical protein